MAKFFGNAAGKALSVVLAVLLLLCAGFAFAACSGKDYPQVRITIRFDDNDSETEDEYVLNYRFIRKLYPQTVDHYIELIEAGFYDNTVIHDFRSDRMVGGGYTYTDMEGGDNVDDLVSLADSYNALDLTPSVWADAARTQPLNTLYGEVTKNGADIEGGGYTNEKGAIGTYTYLQASDLPATKPVVYAQKSSDGSNRDGLSYLYNAVTSMFYLYTGSSSSAESTFCVFGVLADDDSKTRFDELTDAIAAYQDAMTEEDDSFSFTEEATMEVEDGMTRYGDYDIDISVPAHARIVLVSAEVISK